MLSVDHNEAARPRLGCIVGSVAAFAIVLLALGLLLPALAAKDQARSPRARCLSNLKQILYACALYAGDNNELFPPDLGTLHSDYASDPGLFISPDSYAPVDRGHAGPITDENVTYCYVSGLTAADPVHYVLVFDEEWNHDGEGVHHACIGGQVAWETDIAAVHDQLAKQEAELAAKGRTMEIIRPSWSTWPEGPPRVEPPPRSWWIVGGTAALTLAATAMTLILLRRRKRRRA